jgi:hypothetical protein
VHDVFHITRANGGTRSCPLKVQGARSRSRRDARPPPGHRVGGTGLVAQPAPGLSPGTRSSTAGPRTTLGRQSSGGNATRWWRPCRRTYEQPMALLRRLAMISFTRPWNCPQLRGKSFAWTRSMGSCSLPRAGKSASPRARRRPGGCPGRPCRRTTNIRPGAVRVGTLAVRGKDFRPTGRETKGTPWPRSPTASPR